MRNDVNKKTQTPGHSEGDNGPALLWWEGLLDFQNGIG